MQHLAYQSELCAIMSTSNSKYPEWFLVHCSQKVWADVVCAHTTRKRSQEFHNKHNNSYANLSSCSMCTFTQIVRDGYCYELTDCVSCRKHMKHMSMADLIGLKDIITHFTEYQKKIIVFNYQTRNEQLIKFDKVTRKFDSFSPEATDSQKFFILNIKKYSVQHTRQQFEIQLEECQTGEMVSVTGLFLEQNTCKIRDEDILFQKQCFSQVKIFNHTWLKQDCPKLFFRTAGGLCCPFTSRCRLSICSLNGAIYPHETTKFKHVSQEFAGILMDCTTMEIKQFQENTMPSPTGCLRLGEIQCTPGCAACFPVFRLCVFELDFNGKSMHCPSGAHLKHCDQYECNNMLKCHQSYCVPVRYDKFCLVHIFNR